jgi:acyl-coenzyme A synthetase/AMP-(fatty) acid ligase
MAQLGSRVKPRVDRRRGSCRVRALRSSAGDGALQAADGYFRILGRVDDVFNVAGRRLGTKDLESASPTVAEVAHSGRCAVA